MRNFWLALLFVCGLTAAAQAGGVAELLADQGRAGVRIELEPGWKTYWRMPGETGVAPRFDWSGSENLKSATVLYPAPHRFIDAEGETIGFADAVVFPVLVEALDDAHPMELRLKLDYGVCREICIPATADLSANAVQVDAGAGQAIEQAMALLPQRLPGEAASLKVEGQSLRLALQLPQVAKADDVFVEGAQLAYFRAPKADGSENLILPVDGMEDVTLLRGTKLTLTVTAGTSAYEIQATVQ